MPSWDPAALALQLVEIEPHSDLVLHLDRCIILGEALLGALLQREGDRSLLNDRTQPRRRTVGFREWILALDGEIRGREICPDPGIVCKHRQLHRIGFENTGLDALRCCTIVKSDLGLSEISKVRPWLNVVGNGLAGCQTHPVVPHTQSDACVSYRGLFHLDRFEHLEPVCGERVGTDRVQVQHASIEFDAEPAKIADLAFNGSRFARLSRRLGLDVELGLERFGVSRTCTLEINANENPGRHASKQDASAQCLRPIHDQVPPSEPSKCAPEDESLRSISLPFSLPYRNAIWTFR